MILDLKKKIYSIIKVKANESVYMSREKKYVSREQCFIQGYVHILTKVKSLLWNKRDVCEMGTNIREASNKNLRF